MGISDNLELSEGMFGEKSILLAKSGYGKSYTARVIVEEGLELGNTFIIVDPQGAYDNIDAFDKVHFKKVRKVKEFAQLLAATNKNVILNFQRATIEEQNEFLHKFLREWRKHKQRGIQTIVIDEIHKFAPEKEKTLAKNEVRAMFQEDRSMGQGVIGISQRPARMDKTILAQADNIALGRFNAKADIDAIKAYLENKEDESKIKKFKQGEFLLIGFDTEDSNIVKIRKANTEHSGSSPKNLLTEDGTSYHTQLNKFVKGKKMPDNIDTANEPVKKVIPSTEGFADLIGTGMKVAAGGAVGGLVAGFVSRVSPVSPVPLISTRTLAATGTTIGGYILFRNIPSRFSRTKDVAKYAAAGSAAFWLGSLTWDALNALGVRLPAMASAAIAIATGAQPMMTATRTSGEESGQGVDTDTQFS